MTFSPSFGRIFSPSFKPNSLADAVVAGGWWLSGGISAANCIGAYQAKGVADLATSYINLANPGTYNAAPGTAPTWDVTNGWIFNGTSQYLKTGITAENDQTWSLICRFSNYTQSNVDVLIGAYLNGGSYQGIMLSPYWSGGNKLFFNGGNASHAGVSTSGVLAVGGNIGYLNGSAVTGAIGANAGDFYPIKIGVGGTIADGVVNGSYSNVYIQACAIYDIALTSTQVGLLTTAMNAL